MKLKEPARLVRVMKDQGVTVRGLAAACGLPGHSMIQQLRTGRRKSCSPELGALIARHLDVTTEYLFDVRTSSTAGSLVQTGRAT